MSSISLHGAVDHGASGEFRVTGEAYQQERPGGRRGGIYDYIQITVDGFAVDLFLDRWQVVDLHTKIGEFLADNPIDHQSAGALALPSES